MPRREREQERRQLVRLVVEFARMPRPLDAASVEAHFLLHPWFHVSGGGPVIKGISQAPTLAWPIHAPGPAGTAGVMVGTAVTSASVIPAAVFTAAPLDAPPLPLTGGWIVSYPACPYEGDQETVRQRLRQLVDGPLAEVKTWVDDTRTTSPDLVGATFDWDAMESRLWLSGVQGACLFAIALLLREIHRMRSELRWCDTCGPWVPSGGGRPTDQCECGASRRRALY